MRLRTVPAALKNLGGDLVPESLKSDRSSSQPHPLAGVAGTTSARQSTGLGKSPLRGAIKPLSESLPRNGMPSSQRARCRVLHRACLSVAFYVEQRGLGFMRATGKVSRRYNGRVFCNAPDRRLALSAGTLRRLYRRWQKSSKAADAFRLLHRSGLKKLDAGKVAAFVETCLASGAPSYALAYAAHGDRSVTVDAFYHALAPTIRHHLRKLFALRPQDSRRHGQVSPGD